MRVFRAATNPNIYRYFIADAGEDVTLDDFDGTPRSESWIPPPLRVYKPKLKPTDFFNFGSACLITSPKATEALRTLFEMAGELLPLPHQGVEYTLLNVTNCIDCLDHERTVWHAEEVDGEMIPVTITKYVFRKDLFSESSIFKIPEESQSAILVVEGLMEPDEEFREIVRREGLVGIEFEEIWSDGED